MIDGRIAETMTNDTENCPKLPLKSKIETNKIQI